MAEKFDHWLKKEKRLALATKEVDEHHDRRERDRQARENEQTGEEEFVDENWHAPSLNLAADNRCAGARPRALRLEQQQQSGRDSKHEKGSHDAGHRAVPHEQVRSDMGIGAA